MNIENIDKVIAALREDMEKPESHFVMDDFVTYIDDDAVPIGERGAYKVCNTAMCIAGWANTIRLEGRDFGKNFMCAVSDQAAAAEWLGLNGLDAEYLFFAAIVGTRAIDVIPAPDRHLIAIEVLEHLKRTGEVDWVTPYQNWLGSQ